jgi:hypothetical protein
VRRISIAVALVALIALATSAQASIPVLNVSAEPTNTKERIKPARFAIHFELGGSEHIKDLTQRLPKGLEVNALFPTCPKATFLADGCPANTQAGTTTVNATVLGFLPQDITGRIFFLPPDPAFPALGIVLDAPAPFKKAHQIAEISVNQELGVAESVIRNFPQEAELQMGGSVPIRINSLDVVLKPEFVKNPASCAPAVTQLLVTSYEDPGVTTTGSDSYRPTGCDAPAPRRCGGAKVTKLGTPGPDRLLGTPRRDVISGLGGRDVIRGLAGNDVLCGGKGPDRIFGNAGKDLLIGNAGTDRLRGGAGADRVRGGAGRDVERP